MTEILVECPNCKKHTIVQRNADQYQCLSCDFKKDFGEKEKKQPDLLWSMFVAAGAIVCLLAWAKVDFSGDSSDADNDARRLAPIPACVVAELTVDRFGS